MLPNCNFVNITLPLLTLSDFEQTFKVKRLHMNVYFAGCFINALYALNLNHQRSHVIFSNFEQSLGINSLTTV